MFKTQLLFNCTALELINSSEICDENKIYYQFEIAFLYIIYIPPTCSD